MEDTHLQETRQLGEIAGLLQQQRTGLAPKTVTAILSDDTLVVTLHDALTPAEKTLAGTAQGAAQVQEFHRRLFDSSWESMRQEIRKITSREVRRANTEIQPASGAVVHSFTTGALVQMFLLAPEAGPHTGTDQDSLERADDDGFRAPFVGDASI